MVYLVTSHFAKWQLKSQLRYVMCFILDLAYFPSCVAILELFVCDGDSYLAVAPYFLCSEGGALQALAGICLVCYGLGLPVWFSYVVWNNRTNLASGELDHLRFLIDSLDDSDARIAYWPLWRYCCRFFLAVLVTQVSHDEMWPTLLLLLVLTLLAAFQAKLRPYQTSIDNALELTCFSSLGAFLLVCILEAKDDSLHWLRVMLYCGVLLTLFCGLLLTIVVPLLRKRRESQNENTVLLNAVSKR